MPTPSPRPARVLQTPSLPCLALVLGGLASAQDPQPGARTLIGPPALAPGQTTETMWPAPTAEDWGKPCLIPWQRTWDDALAVAKETGRPILICVNMDGEPASEHYAGIRYRSPEIAQLYLPYVTVIASVYRHNPQDYDEAGNRIECPRFGTVTCGEHIWLEPMLFDQYFEGERVAPRHICIELDRSESFDVYYTWDTDSVFTIVRESMEGREVAPFLRGDSPLLQRVASKDVVDRMAVEEAYHTGDREQKRALLREAVRIGRGAPVELLRLAIYDLDPELNRLGVEALAQGNDELAVELINSTLRGTLEESQRESLMAALGRLGEQFPRARRYATVHRGLAQTSGTLSAEQWSEALEATGGPASRPDRRVLEARLVEGARRALDAPEDANARLAIAASTLALAVEPQAAVRLEVDARSSSKYARLMFEDAYRGALEAERLGATGWRKDATVALAAYYLGKRDEAYARAEAAARAVPAGAYEWDAMATVALFAESRKTAIEERLAAKEDWPPEWLSDVHDAYTILARHPSGTEGQVVAHIEFLERLGAPERASEALTAGLQRFPDSWALHERLRGQLIAQRGLGALEAAYVEWLARPGAPRNLEWFAGYASLVAAEFHRRAGADDEARSAYERALAHYTAAALANPESKDSADHYAAVALAGRARLALEAEDWEGAVGNLALALERRPEATSVLDGLGHSAFTTHRILSARLEELGLDELRARLQAAYDAVPEDFKHLPEYEPGGGRRGEGRRRR